MANFLKLIWCNGKAASERQKTQLLHLAESVLHVSWTGEEKEAVFNHLSYFVREGRYPGKRDCENCISKSNGALERKEWCAVKYFVKNQVDKRRSVFAPKNS